MALLDPPAELLDLGDGESVTFTILRYQLGELQVQPRAVAALKTVSALRLFVSAEDKPVGAPYWDATAGNLIARLLPVIDGLVATHRRISVTKIGLAPLARHRVDFL